MFWKWRTHEYNLNLFSNIYLRLNILDGLNFTTSASASYQNGQETNWQGEKADTKGPSGIKSSYNTDLLIHLTSENIFSYDKMIGKSDISAIAGFSLERWDGTSSGITGTGFSFDYIRTINAASTISGASYKHL